MSEYIYGSSLRAAKSKANYLFEGDFRRRPNQNLSGASRSLERGELLQQAAEQRQNRESNRKREQASIKIQSVWRGYRSRKMLRQEMREKFDCTINSLNSHNDHRAFDLMTREFILYYHSKYDEQRFNVLIDFMMTHPDVVIRLRDSDPTIWVCKITKLLDISLRLLEKCLPQNLQTGVKYLTFLELYTRPEEILNVNQASFIWSALIDDCLYSKLRHVIEICDAQVTVGRRGDISKTLIEIIRRSLDIQPTREQVVYSFFKQILQGPLHTFLDHFYLSELMKLEPKGLSPANILAAFRLQLTKSELSRFGSTHYMTTAFSVATSSNQIKECTDAVWLCYSFVRTMHSSIYRLTESEKIEYISILSKLVAPAEYITNISLMQAANNEDSDQNADENDEIDSSATVNQINHYHTEINSVITRIVNIINDLPHINGLNSIIFNSDLQPQVQDSVVRICNLMLAHEPLAIFNCRLLYTVAFSREFSRSLWRSITTLSGANIFGKNTPVYIELTRGKNISHESWESILPQLKLFCSLYSYLLPTLDDEEFYSENDDFASSDVSSDTRKQQSQSKNNATSIFFIDKELVGISAVLRDICVGFIDLLYQDRHAYYNPNMRPDQSFQVAQTKLLSFEIKLCFKTLVRLVCQLHARDSRKQFCPDGHWICPSVLIPANKAIDFQLVSSQKGRLISQMTKDEDGSDRLQTTASEIKTVLILQEIPFVISFHDRVQIFHQLLKKEKLIHQSEGYHFGLPGTAIHVQIRRNYIYEDAFEKLSFINEPNLKIPLKVSMINAVGADEAGIDGGGLSKEFLSELLKAGFDPMRGFFKSTKDQLLYPNPSANVLFASLPGGYEIHYEFLGRILGKAIFEKIMVELPLASFFLAKLLARKHSSDVDLHNLASLDPVLYKNLVYLKNYQGDVADLNLDFTISNNELGEHEVVELKPCGSKIPVTRENKIEYVHLVADYRLNKQIRAQCAAFKRGLSQLVDLDWLRMFDPRELQILVSGAPTTIDVSDWRRNTVYANGYADDCEVINTFWRVTSEFDENQKRKLLKFATSCSLPPLLGFKDLIPQFTIAATEETRLPTASTCMNLLKLPEIEDETTMRTKLLYAIESNSGFELS